MRLWWTKITALDPHPEEHGVYRRMNGQTILVHAHDTEDALTWVSAIMSQGMVSLCTRQGEMRVHIVPYDPEFHGPLNPEDKPVGQVGEGFTLGNLYPELFQDKKGG